MRHELLGAFYENKLRDIKCYLRKHAYSKASVNDICKHTNLRKSEVEDIVNAGFSGLSFDYNGDYIRRTD